MTHQFAYLLLLIVACLYAAVRGGNPERIGAATFLAGSLFSAMLAKTLGMRFRDTELEILAIDAAMLCVFTWLSLRSTRFWPIWVGGALGSEVVVHAMRAMAPRILPAAYLDAQALWGWIALMILLAATHRHVRRRCLYGSDPGWRKRSPRHDGDAGS